MFTVYHRDEGRCVALAPASAAGFLPTRLAGCFLLPANLPARLCSGRQGASRVKLSRFSLPGRSGATPFFRIKLQMQECFLSNFRARRSLAHDAAQAPRGGAALPFTALFPGKQISPLVFVLLPRTRKCNSLLPFYYRQRGASANGWRPMMMNTHSKVLANYTKYG